MNADEQIAEIRKLKQEIQTAELFACGCGYDWRTTHDCVCSRSKKIKKAKQKLDKFIESI